MAVCRTESSLLLVLLLTVAGVAAVDEARAKEACPAGSSGAHCVVGGEATAASADHVLLQLSPFKRFWNRVVGTPAPAAGQPAPAPANQGTGGSANIARRRRNYAMGSCRRRTTNRRGRPGVPPLEDLGRGLRCRGLSMVREEVPAGTCEACLCVFDIDRTLTGKQEQTQQCPRNRIVEPPVTDFGYGQGKATLSALAAEGFNGTFCNQCYLGITSAGHGSGEHSPWNAYILDHVMRGAKHDSLIDRHPEYKRWSFGENVQSPYVLGQGNRLKQNSVELIRQWYAMPGRDICIQPSSVYFFGDRTENIEPFKAMGLNSREISCGSRDPDLYHGSGMVGFCGARPEEIKREQGNILCA